MNCKKCGKYSGYYEYCKKCYNELSEEIEENDEDEEDNLKCPICGEPTRVWYGHPRNDRLCSEHADMLKAKKIEYDDYEEDYVYTDTRKLVKENHETQSTNCVICGEASNGKEVCSSCYKEIINEYDELDKNQKPWELKDYYYNLKASIGRLKNYDYVINNIYRLYAIARMLNRMHNDTQLSDRVFDDVQKLIKSKESLKTRQSDDIDDQTDKVIIAVTNAEKNRAIDGHICKSAGEVMIDNILYRNHVCHAYQKVVKEIDSEIERTVVSDWFVPLTATKGIYIEYWGMDKKDYQDNKEEKIALYEKHNLKLIQIHKNDINSEDILENNLYRQLIKFGWKQQED